MFTYECPNPACGEILENDARMVGQKDVCPVCRTKHVVPPAPDKCGRSPTLVGIALLLAICAGVIMWALMRAPSGVERSPSTEQARGTHVAPPTAIRPPEAASPPKLAAPPKLQVPPKSAPPPKRAAPPKPAAPAKRVRPSAPAAPSGILVDTGQRRIVVQDVTCWVQGDKRFFHADDAFDFHVNKGYHLAIPAENIVSLHCVGSKAECTYYVAGAKKTVQGTLGGRSRFAAKSSHGDIKISGDEYEREVELSVGRKVTSTTAESITGKDLSFTLELQNPLPRISDCRRFDRAMKEDDYVFPVSQEEARREDALYYVDIDMANMAAAARHAERKTAMAGKQCRFAAEVHLQKSGVVLSVKNIRRSTSFSTGPSTYRQEHYVDIFTDGGVPSLVEFKDIHEIGFREGQLLLTLRNGTKRSGAPSGKDGQELDGFSGYTSEGDVFIPASSVARVVFR